MGYDQKRFFFSTLARHSWNPFRLAQTGTHSGRCIFIRPTHPVPSRTGCSMNLLQVFDELISQFCLLDFFKPNFYIVSATLLCFSSGVKDTLWGANVLVLKAEVRDVQQDHNAKCGGRPKFYISHARISS